MTNREKIRQFTEVAERGDQEAQFNLGMLYIDEVYDGFDRLESIYWFKKSAEQGYAPAQFRIGCLLLEDVLINRDHIKGIEWLKLAAKQEHLESILKLAKIYACGMQPYGIKIDLDYDEADYYFEKLFEMDLDVDILFKIAKFYHYKHFIEKSEENISFEMLDDIENQYNYSNAYNHVYDIDENIKAKAIKWYKRAAFVGHISSQHKLGEIYFNNGAVDCDIVDSIYWFKKAGSQGNLESCIKLAEIFFNGLVIKRNLYQAFQWYKKAATIGDGDSSSILIHMYFQSRCKELRYLEFEEELECFVVNYCHQQLENAEEFVFKFTIEMLRIPIAFSSKNHAAEFYFNLITSHWEIELDVYYELAEMYFNGKVVSKNIKYGTIVLFNGASSCLGCPKSQFKLAKMIHDGDIDIHKYADYYEYSIEGMDAIEVAADIYEDAAKNGHVESQYQLALLHYKNTGYGKFCIDDAMDWCEIAVSNGHDLARYFLYDLYIEQRDFFIEKGQSVMNEISDLLDDWIARDEDISTNVAREKKEANKLFEAAEELDKKADKLKVVISIKKATPCYE